MRDVRWGIIGCGDVTELKSGPALQSADGSSLIAVMRRDGELAEDYARRHGVPKWSDQAQDIIDDPEVNAIYIATPPSSHKEYCLKAAAAGKPVYVEKPMARTHLECLEMIDACQKAGVSLYVAYYRRALPKFLKVKEILESGIIGEIKNVSISLQHPPHEIDLKRQYHWRVDPEIAGAGYFYDLGSHIFDLLQYFFGPIKSAVGNSSNTGGLYQAEDRVDCEFQFESGIKGIGEFNFHALEHLDITEITGKEGSISFPYFTNDDIILKLNGEVQRFTHQHPPHIQQPLIETIISDLRYQTGCPSTGVTAATSNWILETILKKDFS